jgi:hypothetical protein
MFAIDFSIYRFMNLMTFQGTIVDIIANTIFRWIIGGFAGLNLGFAKKKN